MSTTSTSNAGSVAGSSGVDTDWDDLMGFRLTVDNKEMSIARVYANGRQQIPFQVEVLAVKNGKRVTLTDSQLKRITLVAYDTGASLRAGVTVSSEKSPQYEYDWPLYSIEPFGGTAQPPRPAPPAEGQVQLLWVSCSSPGEFKVAAKITSPSGKTFTTNARSASGGKFDSWMNILTQPAIVYLWDALVMDDREDVITSADLDVDMYYIKFRDQKRRIVDSIHHIHAADSCFYSWPQPGWPRMSSIAFRTGEPRSVVFQSGVSSSCKLEVNARRGQANAARITHRSGQTIKQAAESGNVTYIDQYGNTVPAVIAVSADGNRLSLQPIK